MEQIIVRGRDSATLLICRLRIEQDLTILRCVVRELEREGAAYGIEEVVARFGLSSNQVGMLEYSDRQIEQLRRRKKFGTARNYQCARNSLAAFLGAFGLMNEDFVMKYNDWLHECEIVKNSISFYMRAWRPIYNRAVKERIVEQTHPFQSVYTGIDLTRKRAVGEEIVLRLLKLDLRKMPSLELS